MQDDQAPPLSGCLTDPELRGGPQIVMLRRNGLASPNRSKTARLTSPSAPGTRSRIGLAYRHASRLRGEGRRSPAERQTRRLPWSSMSRQGLSCGFRSRFALTTSSTSSGLTRSLASTAAALLRLLANSGTNHETDCTLIPAGILASGRHEPSLQSITNRHENNYPNTQREDEALG